MKGASRLDAIIAALVGVLALVVSAYTAWVQKQQVRAQVLPILEYGTGNVPIRYVVANKGVGPALVRHVVVRIDGEPVHDWNEAMTKFAWPGKHNYWQSNLGDHVLAPGGEIEFFRPTSDEGKELRPSDGELGKRAARTLSRRRRDLLLLDARRLLDAELSRAAGGRAHDRDPRLSGAVGDHVRTGRYGYLASR